MPLAAYELWYPQCVGSSKYSMHKPSPKKTRYALVAEELARAIEAGTYAVGDLLPSESELRVRFGVSSHTVRHAMSMLQQMKLTTPERGRGTRVIGTATGKRYTHSLETIPDLGELVKGTLIRVLKRRRIAAADAVIDLPGTLRTWQLIEAIRYVKNGQPLVWKQVYLDPEYSSVARKIGASSEPIYKLIERVYSEVLIRVKQEVGAVLITGEAAKILRVRSGSPGLAIVRHYIGRGGRIFEVTYGIYPASRFRYQSDLRLEQAD